MEACASAMLVFTSSSSGSSSSVSRVATSVKFIPVITRTPGCAAKTTASFIHAAAQHIRNDDDAFSVCLTEHRLQCVMDIALRRCVGIERLERLPVLPGSSPPCSSCRMPNVRVTLGITVLICIPPCACSIHPAQFSFHCDSLLVIKSRAFDTVRAPLDTAAIKPCIQAPVSIKFPRI